MAKTLWLEGKNEAKNGRRYLDGEECVQIWYQGLNSLQQVANILNANGVRTPEGYYISRDAVAKAAWRWIFRNPQKAIDLYIAPGMQARGQRFDIADFWYNYVRHLYTSYASTTLARQLIGQYSLQEYEKAYLETSGKAMKA